MKRMTSVLLAIVLLIGGLPFSINAFAANGIEEKLNKIRTVFDTGSYFTKDGKSHYMGDYSVCPEDPSNPNMPYPTCACCMKQITKNTSGLVSPAEVAIRLDVCRWQCCGFATYVFYNLFECDFEKSQSISLSNAKIGDAVKFIWRDEHGNATGVHYAIYLGMSGDNVIVYDANGDSRSRVCYGSSYSKYNVSIVYRASNYDNVYCQQKQYTMQYGPER